MAPPASPRILKLPKAAAQGPQEIPSVSAAVFVAGSVGTGPRWEQTRAVLGCSHRLAIPGPQARTPSSLLPPARGETPVPGQTLNQLLYSQQTQGLEPCFDANSREPAGGAGGDPKQYWHIPVLPVLG